MRSVSIDLLVLRRFVAAFVALPLVLGGAVGCQQGGEGDDDDKDDKKEEPVKDCDEDSDDEDCEEDPVCGNGVCEDGETDACNDCAPEPVCGNGVCEEGETSACSDCAAPATDATLLVENDSSYTIYFVYMTPCSSPSWGADLLGSDNVILSGQAVEITNIAEGCWDFRAEGSDIYWEALGNYFVGGEYYTLPLTN